MYDGSGLFGRSLGDRRYLWGLLAPFFIIGAASAQVAGSVNVDGATVPASVSGIDLPSQTADYCYDHAGEQVCARKSYAYDDTALGSEFPCGTHLGDLASFHGGSSVPSDSPAADDIQDHYVNLHCGPNLPANCPENGAYHTSVAVSCETLDARDSAKIAFTMREPGDTRSSNRYADRAGYMSFAAPQYIAGRRIHDEASSQCVGDQYPGRTQRIIWAYWGSCDPSLSASNITSLMNGAGLTSARAHDALASAITGDAGLFDRIVSPVVSDPVEDCPTCSFATSGTGGDGGSGTDGGSSGSNGGSGDGSGTGGTDTGSGGSGDGSGTGSGGDTSTGGGSTGGTGDGSGSSGSDGSSTDGSTGSGSVTGSPIPQTMINIGSLSFGTRWLPTECFPDETINTPVGPITLPFSDLCGHLGLLCGVIKALSVLAALRIVLKD